MKPRLFIVGAPKCGTTAWVKYLGEHRQVLFSKIKNLRYFVLDLPGFPEVETERENGALFSDGAPIQGGTSVLYRFSKTAAEESCGFYREDNRLLDRLFTRQEVPA